MTPERESRALGMVVGAAVGDALGAPFEFNSPGLYRRTFPEPVLDGLGEMIGGGGFDWEPGEFTDDTQMAMALAESILEAGTFDPETTWTWFTTWARTARDIGTTTYSSLTYGDWRNVAVDPRASAANGALMRAFVQAAAFHDHPHDTVRDIVLHQSFLTHPNPVSGWGAWICVEMCRQFIRGHEAFEFLTSLIDEVPNDYRARLGELLSPEWTPEVPHESNGSVWGCLAEAVWAVRSTDSYHDAVVAAVDLGDDADTVGCVAGALAGARYGVEAIPQRWRWAVHGRFDGPHGPCDYSVRDLDRITRELFAIQQRN